MDEGKVDAAIWEKDNGNIPSQRRHIAEPHVLERFQAKALRNPIGETAGISIANVNISTSQGPIGGHAWFDQATETLEASCQHEESCNETPRKLSLPEMLFPKAYITIQMSDTFQISWNAMGALTEWSQAHQKIPLNNSEVSHRGVQILQSTDADLWKKTRNNKPMQAVDGQLIQTTQFHYDWTFSSPFCGNTVGQLSWKKLEQSEMPKELLLDRSVPILYFDQIVMMEDDLHDYGLMQYTAKMRVMPSCVYVLTKLYVRIDNDLLRVRDCRLLVHFGSKMIHRDIEWRESAWDQLQKLKLPSDVRSWKTEGTTDPMRLQMIEQLQSKIPLVSDLPDDIMAHSKCSYQDAETLALAS
ncbi:unnamed protein product [Cylindrotheca closterium]|uniref:TIP41-like protein n=1 Tax=Cylindrotheca closterium TaxID=2856 RepID=A0AAD2CYF6_9STRA|nr:unnamed protein product [Cylindrotheca closterium]